MVQRPKNLEKLGRKDNRHGRGDTLQDDMTWDDLVKASILFVGRRSIETGPDTQQDELEKGRRVESDGEGSSKSK